MGLNAGVSTIGVGWGYHDVAALERAGAHAIVSAFDAVEAAIDRLLADSGKALR
jgi:phosphoglycolate phosphatase